MCVIYIWLSFIYLMLTYAFAERDMFCLMSELFNGFLLLMLYSLRSYDFSIASTMMSILPGVLDNMIKI